MVLEESIQFSTVLIVTLAFTVISLFANKEGLKLALKLIAVICWFVMSISSFLFFGVDTALAIPLMFLFLGIGLVFAFSIVTDWTIEKKDRVFKYG